MSVLTIIWIFPLSSPVIQGHEVCFWVIDVIEI